MLNMEYQEGVGRLITRKALAVIAFVGVSLPVAANAALVPDCNPVPGNNDSCGVDDLIQLLVNIYNYLLGMAAVVAILMIIWSGIQMLLYYWDESPDSALTNAKNTLRRAVFGLFLVLAAYLIVATLVYTILGLDGGAVADVLERFGITAP